MVSYKNTAVFHLQPEFFFLQFLMKTLSFSLLWARKLILTMSVFICVSKLVKSKIGIFKVDKATHEITAIFFRMVLDLIFKFQIRSMLFDVS